MPAIRTYQNSSDCTRGGVNHFITIRLSIYSLSSPVHSLSTFLPLAVLPVLIVSIFFLALQHFHSCKSFLQVQTVKTWKQTVALISNCKEHAVV
ncbi:hypothetical protein L1987_87949 [Smallanthus sonchifolius]|nr:hypothetical protein L1987_87949 [Smallanthus sonchifolius]